MKDDKINWRSWLGQSIVDKAVTAGIALLSLSAGSVSRTVTSDKIEYILLFASIAAALALVVVLYLNWRLAKLVAQHNMSMNLHAVNGFIIRHRIHESPRTVLDRSVHFIDPADRKRAVRATLNGHRSEVLDLIREANPELSTTEVDELLDVFFGSADTH